MKPFKISPYVSNLVMPENLRVGLMVSDFRKKCLKGGCSFDYAGFAFGQSPFHVPGPLVDAMGKAADKGHYSAAEGILELRESIAGFNIRHFDIDVPVERIVVGAGTKNIIFTIFSMITGHVIIPAPSWIGYFPQVKLLGKEYHTYRLSEESGFKIDPEKLDTFIKNVSCNNEQHLLVLNNPHNPTGMVYTGGELLDIASVCRKHNVFVLSDEIYALSTYKFTDFVSMGKIYPEGTFVTNGLSKDRSAGGYRLGYCILPETGSEDLFHSFTKIAATVYTNVSTPTQIAAVTACNENSEIEEYFKITRNIHRIMGLHMSAEFNKLDGISATRPEGGFYFYADFNGVRKELIRKGVSTSNQLGSSLLSHPYHIATVTGDSIMASDNNFGARIAFVDYDGRKAFYNYKKSPPETPEEEADFVKKNAPKMLSGVEKLRAYLEWLGT